MDAQPSPRAYLIPAFLMAILGWGGLYLVVNYTLPFVWLRWSFFLLWILALTGTALPFTYLINRRFPSDPPAEPNVIIRQALWVGVYGATLAWLQLGRLVSLYVWMGLAGGLIVVEYLIRLREKARWKPPTTNDDNPA
ncbi:MAG: hypothetical protein HY869_07915 [Chloroflexi bacterium]|nr:hypothetical protein [Chloroflexota bacterium]